MTFDEFQTAAMTSAIYPNIGNNLTYPVLGLCGESGEVAEKVKKILRDCDGIITATQALEIIKELGDVLWYCAAIAHELHISLDLPAKNVIIKLNDRKARGVLQGSGDNR